MNRVALSLMTAATVWTGCGDAPEDTSVETATARMLREAMDRDRDGIPNSSDERPDVADPEDVDNDGIPNAQDLVFPYDPMNGRAPSSGAPVPVPGSGSTSRPPPADPNAEMPCIRNMKPDSDGDGIPDYCDPHYDQGNKDSDGDGVPDLIDLYPASVDGDGDGIPDRDDSEPTVNQQRVQEQWERERLERQRLELERQRLELERQRDHERYLEQQRYRDPQRY